MARSVQEIRQEIQKLSLVEKEDLLRALVIELDVAADPEIDALWLDEAQRRGQEIDEGLVQCVPAEDVFKRLESTLKK
ncbi:MAG TPA: addiction module protein [Steroidobacteraceae bacterium]